MQYFRVVCDWKLVFFGEVSVLGSKNDLLNADLQITCI